MLSAFVVNKYIIQTYFSYKGDFLNSEEDMVGTIIIVGDEILHGEIQDTNYKIAANELESRGIDLKRGFIIPDEKDEIIGAIDRSVSLGADLVVVSGGLGSTHDDVTKSAISRWSNQPLAVNESVLEQIRGIEGAIKKGSKGNHEKIEKMLKEMSMVPEESEIVENPSGINPGFILDKGVSIVVLPGVPSEFKGTLEVALGKLGLSQIEIFRENIELNKPEGFYADSLMRTARKFTDVGVGSYPKIDKPNRVAFRSLNEESLKKAVNFFLDQINSD